MARFGILVVVWVLAVHLGWLSIPSHTPAQSAGPPPPGSGEVIYQCPDFDGLLFGKAELSPQLGTYHIPVCLSGTFLGKLVEFEPPIARLLKSRRWNVDVRLRQSLGIREQRGFSTEQRAKDFVAAHLTLQAVPTDARGRQTKPVQY